MCVIKELETVRSIFFWGGVCDGELIKKGIHWVKWGNGFFREGGSKHWGASGSKLGFGWEMVMEVP